MVWGGHRPAGPWIVLHMYYFSTVVHYRGTSRRDPWSGVVTFLLVPGLSSIFNIYLWFSLQGDEEEGPMVWGGHLPAYPPYVIFSTVAPYRGTSRRDPWSWVVTFLLVPGLSSICIISQQLFTTGGRGGGTHGPGWSPSCWSLDCPLSVIFIYGSHYRGTRWRDPWSGVVTVLLALYVSVVMENRYFL
jgi:hypothetical protein